MKKRRTDKRESADSKNEKKTAIGVGLDRQLVKAMQSDPNMSAIAGELNTVMDICDEHKIDAALLMRDSASICFLTDEDEELDAVESLVLSAELAAANLTVPVEPLFDNAMVKVEEIASNEKTGNRAFFVIVEELVGAAVSTNEDGECVSSTYVNATDAIVIVGKNCLYKTSFDKNKMEFFPTDLEDTELWKKLCEWCSKHDTVDMLRDFLKAKTTNSK